MQILAESLGKFGAVYRKTTAPATGKFFAVECLEDTVFSAIANPDLTGDSVIGAILPAGFVLRGTTTGFTLTSGSVMAYNTLQ